MVTIDGRDPNVYCQCTAHWFRHLRQGYCPPVGSPESMAYAVKEAQA